MAAKLVPFSTAISINEELTQTKANEDKLDSIVAAYTAAWLWKYGWGKNMCIGDERTGYIVTPVNENLRIALMKVFLTHPVVELTPSEKRPSIAIPESTNLESDASAFPADTPVVDEYTEALLRISDTGCLWGKENQWMEQERCVGHVLEVDIIGLSEEPKVLFAPFKKDGISQFGMRLLDDDSKLVWKHIAKGSSKDNVFELVIRFRYRPLRPH